jgi:hypothetical protein
MGRVYLICGWEEDVREAWTAGMRGEYKRTRRVEERCKSTRKEVSQSKEKDKKRENER